MRLTLEVHFVGVEADLMVSCVLNGWHEGGGRGIVQLGPLTAAARIRFFDDVASSLALPPPQHHKKRHKPPPPEARYLSLDAGH
jgi:hypothetical protein